MKVEFPVLDLTDLDAAHEACAELDAAVDGPWVLLSAGVTFEGFRTQLDIAADHGCSGFMAGRAIWGDAVGRMDATARRAGADLAARRLDELAEVLEGRGAPAYTPVDQAEVAALIGPQWYRGARGLLGVTRPGGPGAAAVHRRRPGGGEDHRGRPRRAAQRGSGDGRPRQRDHPARRGRRGLAGESARPRRSALRRTA